jgi:hypothetical protein
MASAESGAAGDDADHDTARQTTGAAVMMWRVWQAVRGVLGATFVITNVCLGAAALAVAPAVAQTQTQQLVAPAKSQFSDNNEAPALVLPVRLNSRPK